MKKKILFITKDTILKKMMENGEDMSGRAESLLGYNFLDPEKYEKSFVNLPRGEVKGFVGKFCHLLQKPFMKIVHVGIAIEAYPFFKKEIKAADIIFCVTDGIGLGLLLWKKLGFVKADVIIMIMGLPEKIKYFDHVPFVRGLISALLKKAAFITTLSDCAGERLKEYFHLNGDRIKTFHYGADIDFWRPLPEIKKENFILSIGNDGNRDFKTLISALPENTPLKIITKLPITENKDNVELIRDFLTNEKIREMHNQALFAVIPSIKLKEESAGLSSCLQIMATGTAVIISRAKALEELFIDGVDCLFYEPENANDLQEKIKTLLNDKDLRDKIAATGRKKVLENYTCQTMAERLDSIIYNNFNNN